MKLVKERPILLGYIAFGVTFLVVEKLVEILRG